ncbi:hypothetical protein EKK58_07165 [Candidatus Dependentiae bacterium]|nr:MAG: hypothetical protein EKK58_07165 [Candidatus Dependentiae bacterium]
MNKPLHIDMSNAYLHGIHNNDITAIQTRIQQYVGQGRYQSLPYDCLIAPFNQQEILFIKQQAEIQMTKAAYAALVIVGIGGSHVGIQAVQQLLHGICNQQHQPLIYYVDTIDPDRLAAVKMCMVSLYQQKKEVLLIIISKSGSTIETIANASVLLFMMSPQQIAQHVVCITDQDSGLHQWALSCNVRTLHIPKAVGGRFSVFTAVGLFPLACMGIDITELCAGACAYDWKQDYAALRAVWFWDAIVHKQIPIHDLFINTHNAYSLGLWYRQLMAETLGKKKIIESGIRHVGIMPTISVMTADLHSLGQLYLAGPQVRLTTFLTVPFMYEDFIEHSAICNATNNHFIVHKKVTHIAWAIEKGTMQTYVAQKMCFMHIAFAEKSLYAIGQFMFTAMVEIIYTALLVGINPFDQPEVELYKKSTHDILQ